MTVLVLQLAVAAESPTRAGASALGDPRAVLAVSTIAPASLEAATPQAAEPPKPTSFLLAAIDREMPITSRPGGGRLVGTMPASSRFYAVPTVAWVRRVSRDGRFGLVDVPYTAGRASGWIALRNLDTHRTRVSVVADLSAHRITVRRGGDVLFRAPAATGAPSSPTPVGRYFVTDRVPFSGGPLGTFAFGISGIQPRLPSGWTGGDQLAIHGTNAPSTIGQSASAGCLRVSEAILERLKPLLGLGTPVLVKP